MLQNCWKKILWEILIIFQPTILRKMMQQKQGRERGIPRTNYWATDPIEKNTVAMFKITGCLFPISTGARQFGPISHL